LIKQIWRSFLTNLVQHYELRRPTRKRVSRVIRLSVGIATIIYFVISVMGYLSFRGHVPDDILLAYGKSPLLTVGRAGMIITLCCGVPLLTLPCRDMLHDALFPRKDKSISRIFIISLVLLGSALLMAVSIPNIAVVWDFLGATTSTVACFVCPAVFYLRLRKKPVFHDLNGVKALLLLVTGAVMCVLCTIDSIMNVTSHKS
jgi:amino acid permease